MTGLVFISQQIFNNNMQNSMGFPKDTESAAARKQQTLIPDVYLPTQLCQIKRYSWLHTGKHNRCHKLGICKCINHLLLSLDSH